MKKKLIIISIIVLALLTSIYIWARYIETNGLKVKEYKIEANINDNFHGLKIVHFTDLHYGSTIDKNDLKKMAEKINFIKPDIVVFTGDLTDKFDEESLSEITNELIKINTTIGKFAVSGNQDNNSFEEIITKAGFTILNNDYELIYKNDYTPILIAGVNSNLLNTNDISEKLKDTYDYIQNNNVIYKILLTHEPDIIDKTNLFDLILAGHSHNSQINLPIIKDLLKEEGAKNYYKPYYKINNTDLYISGGLGTTKFKLRMFNKPSINFYRIVKG